MNHESPTGTGLVDPASNTSYRMGATPLSPAPTTSLAERARLWRLLRDSPWFEEDGKILAARRSERAAKRLVSLHHSTNFGHIFSNKRVPRDPTASATGRYELDLLVITPRRVVNLEIKNWSGKLRVQHDQWVQQRRDGSELAHDNLLSYNRDKLLAVRRYLQHCGVTLPVQRFHQAVVFDNPNLDLDPALERHPAVLRLDRLSSVLGSGTSGARHLLAKVLERIVNADEAVQLNDSLLKAITPAQLKAAAEAVQRLRTWDRLTLRGGRVLQGDVVWLRLCGTQIPASALTPGGEARLTRRRDLLGLCSWVIMGGCAGTLKGNLISDQHLLPRKALALDPQDCIYFHEVGLDAPSVIGLGHVERVQMG
jgi:hypothetical protein